MCNRATDCTSALFFIDNCIDSVHVFWQVAAFDTTFLRMPKNRTFDGMTAICRSCLTPNSHSSSFIPPLLTFYVVGAVVVCFSRDLVFSLVRYWKVASCAARSAETPLRIKPADSFTKHFMVLGLVFTAAAEARRRNPTYACCCSMLPRLHATCLAESTGRGQVHSW